jgi:hypothetical protein
MLMRWLLAGALAAAALGCDDKPGKSGGGRDDGPGGAKSKDPVLAGASADERKAIDKVKKLGGAVFLNDKTPDRRLLWVSFVNSEVTDDDLTVLKDLGGDLQKVDLTGTKITDAALLILKDLSSVEGLDLAKTEITDTGLAHLNGMPNLKSLNVMKTNVTEDGYDAFKKANPKVKVYFR